VDILERALDNLRHRQSGTEDSEGGADGGEEMSEDRPRE